LRFIISILLFFQIGCVYAQNGNKYPIEMSQFMKCGALYNPASPVMHNKVLFQTGLLQFFSPYGGIRTFYGSFNYQINSRFKQSVGFNYIGDKEGDLISRNYLYAKYNITVPLNENYSLTSGISYGLASYSFNGTSPNSIGADSKPDGNLGLNLGHKKWNVGYALNQITNSELKPIDETYRLARFSTLSADYKWAINEKLNLKAFTINRFYAKNAINNELALLLQHQDFFSWGAGYKTQRGFTVYAGLDKIPILEDRFHLLVSYFVPSFVNKSLSYNFIEFNLCYGVDRK